MNAGGFFATHEGWRLVAGIVLIAVNLALLAVVRNGVIRRRLRFTLWTTLLYVAVHVIGVFVPGLAQFDQQRDSFEKMLLVLAVITGAVSLINPWFRQGVPDRLPSILQDTIVLALFGAVAVGWFHEQLALTSAVGAAVIGFALQDTLGNAFAGLAIQIDRPFRVGHWITVGSNEGLVTEITWRATKLKTKQGNLAVVPNNIVSKEPIHNYSEPEAPTRIAVEIGVSYATPPNETKAAILAALAHCTRALKTPAPDVVLVDFAASALTYRVRFWINDFAHDEIARDEVRTFIYYELRRRNIEIPFPIQVQYTREEAAGDSAVVRDRIARLIASVPVFASLPEDAHAALAAGARMHEYAAGEAIVREGEPGDSMFIVDKGRVDIVIGGSNRVASTDAGGYFGEMSLLTGAPRTAAVVAAVDSTIIEVDADAFRSYVQANPDVLSQLAAAASKRQQELDTARANAPAAAAEASSSLLQKMRAFFGL